jgi:hypothetical protein
MARDITETRREKVLAHLKASGGSLAMPELHEWSSLKLLCGHQAFSQLMEGLVDDGHVRWDGTTFVLNEGVAASTPATAAAPDHDHDHDHDHGGDHDHDHDHGGPSKPHPKDMRYGDGSEVEIPREKPRRVAPPPPPLAEPKVGLRSSVKGAFKKLLGR